jgi:hypothetical protein
MGDDSGGEGALAGRRRNISRSNCLPEAVGYVRQRHIPQDFIVWDCIQSVRRKPKREKVDCASD